MSGLYPALPPAPDYVPFHAGPFRLAMGLVTLDLRDWIEPDAQMAVELAEKARLLHERYDEVFAVLPEAMAGASETLALLVAHLPARFPELYRCQGERFENLVTGEGWDLSHAPLHPLEVAGRLVQEDLCLMQRDPEAELYRLVGATVCFPTRWRLADKLGRAVGTIHDPVPGYEAQLANSMERFFARLKPERPVWRVNWSLIDSPHLFQPRGHGQQAHNPAITAHNAGTTLWLRMERQTLRRLPHSGDILFTIRVYVRPLEHLLAYPARAAAIAAAIRALPPVIQRYKSFAPFQEAVLAWLDRVAALGQP